MQPRVLTKIVVPLMFDSDCETWNFRKFSGGDCFVVVLKLLDPLGFVSRPRTDTIPLGRVIEICRPPAWPVRSRDLAPSTQDAYQCARMPTHAPAVGHRRQEGCDSMRRRPGAGAASGRPTRCSGATGQIGHASCQDLIRWRSRIPVSRHRRTVAVEARRRTGRTEGLPSTLMATTAACLESDRRGAAPARRASPRSRGSRCPDD